MKRLYVLLCFIVACSGYAKGQDTLSAIDFEEYMKEVNPRICDSIYRVDTLYYPWEKNVQMIELRWKTAQVSSASGSVYYFIKMCTSFGDFGYIPSIFIFRNRKGKFIKVYSNYLNFIIDEKKFKKTGFVNAKQYKSKYIAVESINNDLYSQNPCSLKDKCFSLIRNSKDNYRGLINRKGDIVVPLEYEKTYINKIENTILLISHVKNNKQTYTYLDYDNLKILNQHNFNRIKNYRSYRNKHTVLNAVTQLYLVDNKGNLLLDSNIIICSYAPKAIVVENKDVKLGLINENLEYLIPHIYKAMAVYFYKDKARKEDYFLKVSTDSSENIVDKNNKALLSDNYNSVSVFPNIVKHEYLFLVEKNNKWGLYNDKFELVLPAIYDKIVVESNHIQVLKDEKWAIYDSDYNLFLDHKFDLIRAELGCFILIENRTSFSILYGFNNKKVHYMPIDYPCDNIKYVELNENQQTVLETIYQGKKVERIELID